VLLTAIILGIFGLFSAGIVVTFFLSMQRAFRKFDSLDANIQMKILRIEYYMVLVRNFSKEKLNELGKLTDKEIECFDPRRDMALLAKETGEKYTGDDKFPSQRRYARRRRNNRMYSGR
jgi:hypothetical protein